MPSSRRERNVPDRLTYTSTPPKPHVKASAKTSAARHVVGKVAKGGKKTGAKAVKPKGSKKPAAAKVQASPGQVKKIIKKKTTVPKAVLKTLEANKATAPASGSAFAAAVNSLDRNLYEKGSVLQSEHLTCIDEAKNRKKFYTIQALALSATSGPFFVFKAWGRIGTAGQVKLMEFGGDEAAARKEYAKTLKSKTSKGYNRDAPQAGFWSSRSHSEVEQHLQGSDHSAMSQCGYRLSLAGEIDNPIKLFRRALELQPRSSTYTNNLAWTCVQRRAYAEGEAMLRQAISMQDPYSGDMSKCNLGLVMALQGNPLDEAELQRIKLTSLGTRKSAADQYHRNAVAKWRADADDDESGELKQHAEVTSAYADFLLS